jgi:hypothetical protein
MLSSLMVVCTAGRHKEGGTEIEVVLRQSCLGGRCNVDYTVRRRGADVSIRWLSVGKCVRNKQYQCL